ncbi:hypothetical protein [Neorickettsia sp. 179522]|uniref:hypothetical protein n=1 Tax=Neorickettsia sp. 179522 TaxID=1714371 RepID=UPI00079C9F68|nr:hypothetical protein [Neorickettsia sp. 179522]KYH12268.1 hypothetical protein AS219_00330 [Neorickettsia sp. 179522]
MKNFSSILFKPVSPSAEKLRRAILHPSSSKTVILVTALWVCIILSYCILQAPQYGRVRPFGESMSILLIPIIGAAVFSFFALSRLPSISEKNTALAKTISEIHAQGGYQALHSAAVELQQIKKPSIASVGACAFFFSIAFIVVGVSLGAAAGTSAYGPLLCLEIALVVAACAGLVAFLIPRQQSRMAKAVLELSEEQVKGIVQTVRLEQLATNARAPNKA